MSAKKYILVVDDEALIAEFLNICLTEEGYAVEKARNGSDAMEKISAKEYHAIITDIRMPVMDGVNFYKKLREVSPAMTENVIFMSGNMDCEKKSFIKNTGRPFFPKPFCISDITKAIEEINIQRKPNPPALNNTNAKRCLQKEPA